MVVMTSLLTGPPRGTALTAHAVAHMLESGQLDDSPGYELIDGVLIQVPAPSPEHQYAQTALLERFFAARATDMRVLAAPFDILSEDTAVQPDIVVIRRTPVRHEYLEEIPMLAVEILSPSTALRDVNTKFKRYERAGIASYWVVDPIGLRLIVWELREGRYVEVADVGPGDEWTSSRPFEVTIRPAELFD